MKNLLRALCKKFSQKNRKTTPTYFVQNFLRIPKLYLACLSDHSWVRNHFLKLAGAPLKSPTFAVNSALQIIGRILSVGKILFYDLLNYSNFTKQYEKGFSRILKFKITYEGLSVWKTFPRKNKVSFLNKNESIEIFFQERNLEN